VLKGSWEYIKFLGEQLTDKEHYSAVFKASIVLITLALISLTQLSNVANIEKEALKAQYSTEKALGEKIEDFNSYKCVVSSKSYVDCKFAKAQLATVKSSSNLILQVYRVAILLGGLLLGLAICGYFQSSLNEFNNKHNK